MGITLHYSGELKKEADLQALKDEIRDISETYQWKYTCFPIKKPNKNEMRDPINGICFSPPDSEPVWLTFSPDRRICNPLLLADGLSEGTDIVIPFEAYGCFTKTQFAGAEVHKLLVHLLKYISKKYFETFNMLDEGYYWETGDEELLKKTFALYSQFINMIGDAIAGFPKKEDEDYEGYFTRLLEFLDKKRSP
jgi:hypothetical protein